MMTFDNIYQLIDNLVEKFQLIVIQPESYAQLGIVTLAICLALIFSRGLRKHLLVLDEHAIKASSPIWRKYTIGLGILLFPLLAILFLRVSIEISQKLLQQDWLIYGALLIAALLLLNTIVDKFVASPIASRWFKWFGMPIVIMHYLGILQELVRVLESISISIGNIQLSAYGVIRVIIFGSLLFWLAHIILNTGREVILRQKHLDSRTREVSIKLYQVTIFFLVFLVILQIMGINLTALAVFGGALGVGLGFGLQSIASNFISGIIILLDRSISVGDFVELSDEQAGYVREMNMRSTTLETFDGKDVMIPNEKFIVETFTNWTHKDKQQRYRVDFSVAYNSDVRRLVEIIKTAVTSHPQVLSGEEYALEMQPDCEIDSFGDSGINMFVEFWMEGIDDGRNRVGGDLLLMIFEAMRENGFEIPFPQREVRVLNQGFSVGPVVKQESE